LKIGAWPSPYKNKLEEVKEWLKAMFYLFKLMSINNALGKFKLLGMDVGFDFLFGED
tara:strand:- start:84 stop:254 length:171 start_codon:yes stop_codon:yes gene_type:complete